MINEVTVFNKQSQRLDGCSRRELKYHSSEGTVEIRGRGRGWRLMATKLGRRTEHTTPHLLTTKEDRYSDVKKREASPEGGSHP